MQVSRAKMDKRMAAVLNIRAVFKSGKKQKLRDVINAKMGYKNTA